MRTVLQKTDIRKVDILKSIRQKRPRSPFLMKLLLTIGLLICTPMLIVQVFIFYSSYQTMRTQNNQYYSLRTQNLSSSFYSQLAAFREIALEISSSTPSSVKKCASPDAPDYLKIEVSEELANYMAGVPLAENIGIYYKEQQILVDDAFYYRLGNFCQSFSGGNEAVYDRVRDLFTGPIEGSYRIISSIPPGAMTPDAMLTNMVLVAIPVRLNSYTEPDAVVYFTISHESIRSFLSVNAPTENYTYAIFDEKGSLLFTSDTENLPAFSSESFAAYLADPAQTTYSFTDSHRSTAYKWTGQDNANTFITIVSESELEENISAFFHVMELTLLLNLVITAAALGLTAYLNYSPLRKLVSRIASPGRNRAASELEQIEQTIRELDSRASDQGVVIMDYVLNDLLYGTPVRQPELERLIPNFHFRYFCAVSVICQRPTAAQAGSISSAAGEQTGCRVYITDIPNRDGTLFVCLSRNRVEPDVLTRSISDAVRMVLGEPAGVFAGSVVEKLDDISASYRISQMKMGGEAGTAILQDYPSDSLQLFASHLAGGQLDAAREFLGAIFSYLERHSRDHALCRYLGDELLAAYLSARRKLLKPVPDEQLRGLLQFQTSDGLRRMLETSLAELETSAPQDAGASQQEEIVAFVEENYQSPDLSLVTVADRFGISIYMVSRLFKNQTGVGFKEYVTARRLTLACQLLAATRDSISSIAAQVGFENPTYFASLFRTRYGVTPSRYRDNAAARK